MNVPVSPAAAALARVLDQYVGRYRELRGAADFGEYVSSAGRAADEQTLTEPMLASLLEEVLGFGKGDYFPQLGKSGLKPDFTPTDLVTHRFVLDAKGTSESLATHVAQIRRYVEQRALRYGVLFNGKQMRVYPSGSSSYDRALSFDLLPLWRAARGEQLPVGPVFDAFDAFLTSFSHRTLSTDDKIELIRREESWAERLEDAVVDVEFLVEQLRQLARALADDAGAQIADLEAYVGMSPDRLARLNDELRLLALDIEPGVDIEGLPTTIAEWSSGAGTIDRVWRQYLLRVAYLSVTRILLYRAWEDVGFVDEMLYDGGFDTAYERLAESVRGGAQPRIHIREREVPHALHRREQLRVVPSERRRPRRRPLPPRRDSAREARPGRARRALRLLRRRDRSRSARSVLHASRRRSLHARPRGLRGAGRLPARG